MRRLAEADDLSQVVEVHLAAFPGFFLSSLGRPFLTVMYRAFLSQPGSVFVIAEDGGRLQGFAVGSLKRSEGDRSLALRYFPSFVAALVPAVLRNPIKVTRRICGQLFSGRGQPEFPDNSAVLRSIGILPEEKGKGLANDLLGDFEKQALVKGAEAVVLTTDADSNDRAIGFYKKNGYEVRTEFRQDGARPMLLMGKHIRVPTQDYKGEQ
ncbi:GNAT family N-acetyltransferase [Cupriavidus metallidurans]|jgi:ribosomal protein S18 acetylase RimI-like enzyme|uniref:GNAT family N-acetyltransferase n=1 Tax=Cupriavidus metallidurans TaxID=119219 RepID=UPI000CE064BD|nr:GNAT family N-acetyltransferase [Cupriavidus metallidurans]AVA36761.1 hypothetical protein C3Z06_26170 [Cupriavidus metallidurans]UBM10284.1 GNAT family N-acetyltransferase [Cupriavidus metallidurans]